MDIKPKNKSQCSINRQLKKRKTNAVKTIPGTIMKGRRQTYEVKCFKILFRCLSSNPDALKAAFHV